MKLDCSKVQEITRMYADCIEDIPDQQAKTEYLAHLDACDICHSHREEILKNIALVKSFGDLVPTKNGLTITQSVMNSINGVNTHTAKNKFRFNHYGTVAAAVIVAVVMIGSQTSLFGPLSEKKDNAQTNLIADTVQEPESLQNGRLSESYLSNYSADPSQKSAESQSSDFKEAAQEDTSGVKDAKSPVIPDQSNLNSDRSAVSFDSNNSESLLKKKVADDSLNISEFEYADLEALKEDSDYIAEEADSTDSEPINTAVASDEEYNSSYITNSADLPSSPQPESLSDSSAVLLEEFLNNENQRVELCVVHPDGYHTIPYSYAEKLGYEEFVKWVRNITNEEVEYTPEHFKQHFSKYFE